MSDDEPTEDGADDGGEATVEDSLREQLEAVAEDLEAAETEADLDEIEAELDAIGEDLDAADLPEPDDEDEEGPADELESELDALRDDLEDARGPYAEDVVSAIEAVSETVEESEWTEQGESDVVTAVRAFCGTVDDLLGANTAPENDDIDTQVESLEAAASAVESADLDPDEDAETIAALLDATDGLDERVDEAQSWADLTVRQKLELHGFYDVIGHHKDFPPEWSALKVFERQGDAEKILLALDLFDSDFMERHCLEALKRMGPEEALEPMLERAGKRDRDAIEILGKIGSEEPVETLLEYVDTDKDPLLQKATFKALGEIGSADAVQPLANKLVAENAEIRSHAARALGLIGDTRAIDPLATVLEDDEEDTVRASAAWALNQIGTEAALEAAAAYADDRAYLVQAEAEKAAETTRGSAA